jgi:SOS-response transcriptional repressor LexA
MLASPVTARRIWNFKRTERPRRIVKYIADYIASRGYAPSFREINEGVKLRGTSTVNYYIDRLVNMGYLEKTPRISRGLRVTLRGYKALGLKPDNEGNKQEMPFRCPHCGQTIKSQ